MQKTQTNEIVSNQPSNSYNLMYCDLDLGKLKTAYIEAESIADAERKFLEKHKSRESRIVVWKVILLDLADVMKSHEFRRYRKRRG